MKAKLPNTDYISNAYNYSGEKELTNRWQLVAFSPTERKKRRAENRAECRPHWDRPDDGFRTVVDARCWMGRSSQASVVYCSVWIHCADGRSYSGKGTAGGWGYCKASAAFQDALTSAGIELYDSEGKRTNIRGAGESAIRVALHAIAKAAGYGQSPRCIV